jgi:hypothetical protein
MSGWSPSWQAQVQEKPMMSGGCWSRRAMPSMTSSVVSMWLGARWTRETASCVIVPSTRVRVAGNGCWKA